LYIEFRRKLMETIYNSQEISEKTGVSMRTLQRWSKAGIIGKRLGREYMYTEKDISIIEEKKQNKTNSLTKE
jgi:DNA-binding transcriptional MerR regulator